MAGVLLHQEQQHVDLVKIVIAIETSKSDGEGGAIGHNPLARHFIKHGIGGQGGPGLAKGFEEGVVCCEIGVNAITSGQISEEIRDETVVIGDDAGE